MSLKDYLPKGLDFFRILNTLLSLFPRRNHSPKDYKDSRDLVLIGEMTEERERLKDKRLSFQNLAPFMETATQQQRREWCIRTSLRAVQRVLGKSGSDDWERWAGEYQGKQALEMENITRAVEKLGWEKVASSPQGTSINVSGYQWAALSALKTALMSDYKDVSDYAVSCASWMDLMESGDLNKRIIMLNTGEMLRQINDAMDVISGSSCLIRRK